MKTTRNRANASGPIARSSTSEARLALRSAQGEAGHVLRSPKGEAGHVLRSPKGEAGFTLLEVLVAMTIMAILGAALFTMFNESSRTWQRAEARTSQFTAAREMLGMMAMELRQAVVNPHAGGTFGAHFYGLAPGSNDFNRPSTDSNSGQIYFVAPTETRSESAQQDVCVIGYWVRYDTSAPNNDTTPVLMRYCLSDDESGWSSFAPNSSIDSQDLGLDVRSLTFKFWGPGDSDWKGAGNTWSSETAGPQQNTLPRAVQITLVVQDPMGTERDRTFTTVVRLDAAP
jgi:prepilin-type N-terminal cleavage/methylation domain-containing protein